MDKPHNGRLRFLCVKNNCFANPISFYLGKRSAAHRINPFFTHVRGLGLTEDDVFCHLAITVTHFLHVSVVLNCQKMLCFDIRQSPRHVFYTCPRFWTARTCCVLLSGHRREPFFTHVCILNCPKMLCFATRSSPWHMFYNRTRCPSLLRAVFDTFLLKSVTTMVREVRNKFYNSNQGFRTNKPHG